MGRSFGAMRRSVTAMVPALMLGLAAGVTGGVWAASALDTTPYNATDFNTASRDARLAGKSEGWEEAQAVSAEQRARIEAANEEQVDGLEAKLDELRKAVKKQDRALKDAKKAAKKQDEKLATVRSSLAETAAALNNATGELGNGQSVQGTLKITQVLTRKAQEAPSCAESLRMYEVRVLAGADVTVATARLVNAEGSTRTTEHGTRRNPKPDTTVISCSLTYAANLPTPLGSSYRFVVVQPSKSDAALVTKQAAGAGLAEGAAPTMSISR